MQQPRLLLEGKYEILAKIREGGMGSIYRVRHRLLDEVRVIKVMQPHVIADADLKRRFLEEAKTAIRLKHPNICTLHDYAVDEDGTAYLVMEYIDGANLSDLLRLRGSPGVALSIEIAHQALLALGYLHRKGVIHRDIAPDNLMLTHDEEGKPLVKLIDLGIAKAANRSMDMTATGVFLGKLKYASPEQYGTLSPGERIDGRSDIYGLGIVLYELLTGVRPFKGESPAELLRAHLFTPPLPFSESDREGKIPEDLRAVILKALEKKREDRFPTAEDFDREIVNLRETHARPEDLQAAMAVFSTIRSTQPAVPDNVTPSAQDRLDRQFGSQTTPSPSLPPFKILVPPEARADPGAAAPTLAVGKDARETESSRPTEGAPPHPEGVPRADLTEINPSLAAERASAAAELGRPGRAPEKAAASPPAAAPAKPPSPAVAKPQETRPAAPERAKPPAGGPARVEKPAAPAAPSAPIPGAPPRKPSPPAPGQDTTTTAPYPRRRLGRGAIWAAAAVALAVALLLWRPWSPGRPTAPEESARLETPSAGTSVEAEPTSPPVPSPAPTAAPAQPTAAPTARPAPSEERPQRPAAEAARKTALEARQSAEEGRARELAPATYRRGLAFEREGEKLFGQGSDVAARQAFDSAARSYGQALRAAQDAARPAASPSPVRVAELPTALPRPTAVPAFPTAFPAPPTSAPAPALEVTRIAPVEERPAPPPTAAPPVRGNPAEERKIRDTIRLYEQAWSRFDAKLYERVYPSGVQAFEIAIKNLRSQYVNIEIRSIDVDSSATRASVSGNEVIVATPKAGNEQKTERDVTLQLQKREDRWVIVSRN